MGVDWGYFYGTLGSLRRYVWDYFGDSLGSYCGFLPIVPWGPFMGTLGETLEVVWDYFEGSLGVTMRVLGGHFGGTLESLLRYPGVILKYSWVTLGVLYDYFKTTLEDRQVSF